MMFQKNKIILLSFNDSKVEILKYLFKSGGYLIEDKKTADITDEIQKEELINEKIDRVQILIPDEENYLKLLSFPKTQKISKTIIAKEIENYIPENVIENNIYWEKIEESEEEIVISVRVIKDKYMKQILDYLEKINTQLDRIYFESEIIAKNSVDFEIPEIVVVNKENRALILVVFKGKTWQSLLTDKDKTAEIINQTKRDFEYKWKIKLDKISEEKGNIFEMLQNKLEKKNSYEKTVNLLLIMSIIVGLIVLIIFIPMIWKNMKETQTNLVKIQQISK